MELPFLLADTWLRYHLTDVSSCRITRNSVFPSLERLFPLDFWLNVRAHFSVDIAISMDSMFRRLNIQSNFERFLVVRFLWCVLMPHLKVHRRSGCLISKLLCAMLALFGAYQHVPIQHDRANRAQLECNHVDHSIYNHSKTMCSPGNRSGDKTKTNIVDFLIQTTYNNHIKLRHNVSRH